MAMLPDVISHDAKTNGPGRAGIFGGVWTAGETTGMMLAGAAYIAKWVLRDDSGTTFLFVALIAPALICAPLWSVISRRTGKELAFGVASVLFGLAALSLVMLVWMPGPWLYAPVALAGAAYAGMQTLPMAMLPDVISHDAKTNGPGRAGIFGGVWTAGETTGMALGAVVLTLILALTGYQEAVAGVTVEQSANAITGIVLSFSIVPAIMIGLSLWSLGRYPLRRSDIDEATAASAIRTEAPDGPAAAAADPAVTTAAAAAPGATAAAPADTEETL
jgi:Na+/melibiose symporter-like transporter